MTAQSLLISASIAWTTLFIAVALGAGLLARRSQNVRELTLFSLSSLSLALVSAASALQLASRWFAISAADLRALGAFAAAALTLDLAGMLSPASRPLPTRAGYLLALASMAAVVGFSGRRLAGVTRHASLFGHPFSWVELSPSVPRGIVYAALVACLVATTVRLLDASITGARRLGWMSASHLVLTSTLSFDLTAWWLALPIPRLSEHAAGAFVMASAVALFSRELDRRDDESAGRARELVALNEVLTEVRAVLVQREPLALVGELSAIVAHEVRNPIGIITNAAASLRKPELHPADRVLLLTIIEEECDRLNRIVTDLLALARPMAPQRIPAELNEMLDRSLAIAHRAGIDVTLRVAPDANGALKCDAMLFRQALENVVANAVQAMGRGGSLAVSISRTRREGRFVREITVIDTGEGMNTEVRSKARKAFFTTRTNGTGLGLAIVERIVIVHEGLLEIESAKGAGTTVKILLPDD